MKHQPSAINGFITILLILTLSFFSLGNLMRINIGDVQIHAYELLYAGLVLALITQYGIEPMIRYKTHLIGAAFFFGWLCISFSFLFTRYNLLHNIISFLYIARLALYALGGIYLYYYMKKRKEIRTSLAFFFPIWVVMIIGGSWVQFVGYPNLRIFSGEGWDPHLYRMTGTFLEPAFAAALYGLLFLFAEFFLPREDTKPLWLKARIILPALLVVCFFLTFSRAAYLAGIVTLWFLPSVRKHALAAAIIFLMGAAGMMLWSSEGWGQGVNLTRTETIQSRADNYTHGLLLWNARPITGLGYNRIAYERARAGLENEYRGKNNYAAFSFHSSFLVILVTAGFIGLTLFVFVLSQIAELHLVAQISILFLSIFSLFDNILLHPFILFTLSVWVPYAIFCKKKRRKNIKS